MEATSAPISPTPSDSWWSSSDHATAAEPVNPVKPMTELVADPTPSPAFASAVSAASSDTTAVVIESDSKSTSHRQSGIRLPHGSNAPDTLFDQDCHSFFSRLGIRTVTVLATPFIGGAFIAGAVYATARACYFAAATLFEAGASLFTWDKSRLVEAKENLDALSDAVVEAITQTATAAMLVPFIALVTLVDPTATAQRLALIQDAWGHTTSEIARLEDEFRLHAIEA